METTRAKHTSLNKQDKYQGTAPPQVTNKNNTRGRNHKRKKPENILIS